MGDGLVSGGWVRLWRVEGGLGFGSVGWVWGVGWVMFGLSLGYC